MIACIHFASEVKYEVSEIILLNLLKLIITLSFLLNYTTKLQKSPVLWGIFIRIRGYFVPTAISLPKKIKKPILNSQKMSRTKIGLKLYTPLINIILNKKIS